MSPTPLRIALVLGTPGTGWGGMEKHTLELASQLAGKGHSVSVLAHLHYRERFPAPIRFIPLPVHLGRRNPWLWWSLRGSIRQIRPDICHAQGNKAAYLITRAIRGENAPTRVGSVHGTKSSHRDFASLDGVIGVSQDIVSAVDHPNGRLIYNGSRLPLPAPGPPINMSIPEQRPLLVAAGRLEPVKQFDRLIRAWVTSGIDGQLVILGDGSEHARLERLAAELEEKLEEKLEEEHGGKHRKKHGAEQGATRRITLPGFQPDIHPWLQAASACVISSAREGFPYVMVEALLAGCPVLSTPVSGVHEFLPPACIARSDSEADLAALIASTLGNPDSLRQQQQDCFARARRELTLEAMAEQTLAFYRELLAAKSSGQQ